MRNENYINELVEFLNDDALTEMEIQTEFGEDERFETFIKLKRTSPRAGKPMLCVYGVPTHRKGMCVAEKYILMGVWLKDRQRLVICNPDGYLFECLYAPDFRIPILEDYCWRPTYENELLKQEQVIRAKLEKEVSIEVGEEDDYRWSRQIAYYIITGEAGYPANAFRSSFHTFDEDYRKQDRMSKLWMVVEPEEFAAEVAKEYLEYQKDAAVYALTNEGIYKQELERYQSNIPELVKYGRNIFRSIPEGAKTVGITISVGEEQLSGKIATDSLLVGEPTYYTFGISPAPVQKECEAALGGCTFRADQVEEIRYRGKIIYQKKEGNR